ncbi:MAG: NAD(P)-binding domain-containing protein [Planctomycetota bacterium]|jgi:thioredoxin reductase
MSSLWYGLPFLAVLALVAFWQHLLERRRRDEVVSGIREARDLGADRPQNQHPQIEPLSCIGCAACVRACPESGVIEMVDGIAHVVRAASCVGHAVCEIACPVGALKVGLGELENRPDRPRLTSEFETTVPGIFVAGELGGLALIRNAVEAGKSVIDSIAARPRPPVDPDVVDVLIVGAGPCGMTASLRAIEHGLSWITIDQDDLGGTVRKYPRRKLVLTQPVDLPLGERIRRREYAKEELIEFWTACMDRHGAKIRAGVRFAGVALVDGMFVAETSGGPIRCRTVLLALGRRGTPRKLGVPGEQSERVLYQLVDAATYRGERVLVVGGGDSALEAATALASQPGNQVTLSYRKADFFRAKKRNLERVREFVADGRVEVIFSSSVRAIEPGLAHVALADGSERALDNDYVFVFAGGEPPYPLLAQVGVGMGPAQ